MNKPLANEELLSEIVHKLAPVLHEVNLQQPDKYNVKTVTFIELHPNMVKCEACEPTAVSCQRCVVAIWEKGANESDPA